MNRTLLYLFVLLGLGVAIWFFVLKPEEGAISIPDTAFSVEDTSAVGKIFMADLGGKQITLDRGSRGWTVNGGSKARPDAIETLLSTIHNQRVKYPVAKSAHNNVVRELSGEHIKVEVYNRNNELMVAYYVGAPPKSDRGNYMMLVEDRKQRPYIIQIAGLDGFLHTRYILEENDWRDRTVFSVDPDRIQSLTVSYPVNPDSSWTINRTAEQLWELEPETLPAYNRPVNARATLAYLRPFRQLNAEVFMNDYIGRDSVANSTPICVVSLTTTDGESQECRFHFRAVNRRTKQQMDVFGNQLDYSRDKYYAVFNNRRDFALVQDFVFGRLFVGPSYFVQPEPQ